MGISFLSPATYMYVHGLAAILFLYTEIAIGLQQFNKTPGSNFGGQGG